MLYVTSAVNEKSAVCLRVQRDCVWHFLPLSRILRVITPEERYLAGIEETILNKNSLISIL
jgi:hypothetical protein